MLIWSYWPGHEGGAERQCYRISEILSKEGIDFVILTSLYAKKALKREKKSSGTIVRLGVLVPFENHVRRHIEPLVHRIVKKFSSERSAATTTQICLFWLLLPLVFTARISFIIALWIWFKHHGKTLSLIHVHESDWIAGVGAWLGEMNNIPVLAKTATAKALPTLGYDVPFRGLWNRKRRQCHFLAQHNAHFTDLVAEKIPEERISIISNGVSIPAEVSTVDQDGPCLYVGNFSQGAHWKAFDILIEAWSLVHKISPRANLIMIGGGEYAPWKHLADQLGCNGSIHFYGKIDDPSSIYLSSSMFILPSRIEGLSNALLEAQSYGLPCVVSDIPANLEVIQAGENGLVVPVGNAEQLATAVIKLLNEPELRTQLGKAARERVIQKYSLAVSSNRLKEIYCLKGEVRQ